MSQGDKTESKKKDAAARDRLPEGFVASIPLPPKPHIGLAIQLLPGDYPLTATNLLDRPDNGWIAHITGYISRSRAKSITEWCQSLQVKIVFTFAPHTSPQDDYATQDVDDLCDTDIAAILDPDSPTGLQFERYGYTTIWKDKVALSVIPCDRDPVEFLRSKQVTLEPSLNEIRQRIDEVQKAREVIDAQRDQWLHLQAEPILDEVHELLKSISLPSQFREQLEEVSESLRRDAYGYSDLIETHDIQTILNVRERQARELSQKGELGIPFTRTYVHSRKEAENVAKRIRKPGPPPKTE